MLALFNNLSIRIRLVILITLIVVGMAAFLMLFFPRTLGSMAESWLQRRAEVIAHVLSDALSGYVEWDDADGAKALLERLGPATEIEYAAVRELTDVNGTETIASENFAAWMPELLPDDLDVPGRSPTARRVGGHLLVSMRINSTQASDATEGAAPPRTVGALYVGISLADLDAQRQEIMRIVFLVSLGLALVGVLIAFAIGTIIVRPIRALTEVTANIVSKGDLTQTIDVTSEDEVGQLAQSFRAMVEKLQAIPRSLAELVDSVTAVTDVASQTTNTVSDGASTVHARVADAAAAMHQMTATLASIAANVDELHLSAERSTRSNQGMVEATQQITGRVVTMASSADGANLAVEKMTAAIKEIAARINELDASVETTASSMTEIHSSIQSVERTAVETNKLSQRVAEDAVTGVAALERTLAGIDKITDSSAAVSTAIESLGARIQNIGSILEVILEVATQTKLLALNAAILAAQAGEHGRGFGILADQIKGLAARTNASATEIGDLITNIQSESDTALATMREGSTYVEEGVRLANETAEVLRAIEKSANSASTMVQRITDATVEQSHSTKRVLASIDTIAVTVQEVNRAAGEQVRGSEQIVAATLQMKISTDAVRLSSSEQADATQGIAVSVANIHDMAAQLARAQSEQTSTANNTLSTVEMIKTVADAQLHAIGDLERAIRKLREHSDQLRATIGQFRV